MQIKKKRKFIPLAWEEIASAENEGFEMGATTLTSNKIGEIGTAAWFTTLYATKQRETNQPQENTNTIKKNHMNHLRTKWWTPDHKL